MQYIFFLLLLSCYFSISAESYLPILTEEREWVTKFTYMDKTYSTSTTPIIYSIDGDTVLNDGTIAKKLLLKAGPTLYKTNYALVEKDNRLELRDKNNDVTILMDLSVNAKDEYIAKGFRFDVCDFGGIIRKRLYDPQYPQELYIEGVGPCLRPFHHFNPDIAVPTDGKFEFLQAVWDNGKLIGKREDFLRGIENEYMSSSWIPMIRNDRSWIYRRFNEDGSYYLSYWKFGESERIFGLEYTYAYEYKRIEYPDSSNPEFSQKLTPGITIPSVWVHEDAGQISTLSPSFDNGETLEELALRTQYMNQSFLFLDKYDFLEYYDYFASYLQKDESGNWNYDHYFQVEDISTMQPILINGELRRQYALRRILDDPDPIVCIEGIGALSHAFLPYILRPDKYPLELTPRLIYYCDGDGNVIHKFADLPWEETGLTSPGINDIPAKTSLTDLFGRPVSNPIAGSIYIRDGKKILWK